MEIVFLDALTTNPDGNVDWRDFEKLGRLTLFDRTQPNEIVERSKNAMIILTNKVALNESILSALPNLKFICVMATGYNLVDVIAAKKLGILVANIPSYSSDSVAQHTWALLLELTNQIGKFNDSVRETWPKSLDFCYNHSVIFDLSDKTIGLIGLGDIGIKVAKIAEVFGMKVIATSNSMVSKDGIRMVDLDNLLEKSDVISLHCPLNSATKEIISESNITKMKASVLIINTARGGLVNEKAVQDALLSKLIGGFATDVLSVEPPLTENYILNSNAIITPHIAWGSSDSRRKLLKIALSNIQNFIKNTPINIVNN